MAYKGHVKDGTIVLDDAVSLPEGTPVKISVLLPRGKKPLHPDIIKFTGILPPDIDVKEEYYQDMMKKHQ